MPGFNYRKKNGIIPKMRNDKFAGIKKLYKGQGFITFYTYLRFWEDNRLRRIEKMIPKSGTILDLGCGYGIFSNYLALCSQKRKIIGVEIDKDKIRIAKKAALKGNIQNISFYNDDINKIKIPSVDAIVIMHVLHHLDSFQQQKQLLKICVDKLLPGGILLIDEVEKNISFRYPIVVLADNLLYFNNKFYFRTKKEMLDLLGEFPLNVEVKNVSDFLMPFPELVFYGKKINLET